MVFKHSFTVKFEEADPAGIVFFSNYFKFAHNAIEEMTHKKGIWELWFKNPDLAVPLKNANADYIAPLFLGKTYCAEVSVQKLGNSSIHFETTIKDDSQQSCAKIATLHVFIHRHSKEKVLIPEAILSKISE